MAAGHAGLPKRQQEGKKAENRSTVGGEPMGSFTYHSSVSEARKPTTKRASTRLPTPGLYGSHASEKRPSWIQRRLSMKPPGEEVDANTPWAVALSRRSTTGNLGCSDAETLELARQRELESARRSQQAPQTPRTLELARQREQQHARRSQQTPVTPTPNPSASIAERRRNRPVLHVSIPEEPRKHRICISRSKLDVTARYSPVGSSPFTSFSSSENQSQPSTSVKQSHDGFRDSGYSDHYSVARDSQRRASNHPKKTRTSHIASQISPGSRDDASYWPSRSSTRATRANRASSITLNKPLPPVPDEEPIFDTINGVNTQPTSHSARSVEQAPSTSHVQPVICEPFLPHMDTVLNAGPPQQEVAWFGGRFAASAQESPSKGPIQQDGRAPAVSTQPSPCKEPILHDSPARHDQSPRHEELSLHEEHPRRSAPSLNTKPSLLTEPSGRTTPSLRTRPSLCVESSQNDESPMREEPLLNEELLPGPSRPVTVVYSTPVAPEAEPEIDHSSAATAAPIRIPQEVFEQGLEVVSDHMPESCSTPNGLAEIADGLEVVPPGEEWKTQSSPMCATLSGPFFSFEPAAFWVDDEESCSESTGADSGRSTTGPASSCSTGRTSPEESLRDCSESSESASGRNSTEPPSFCSTGRTSLEEPSPGRSEPSGLASGSYSTSLHSSCSTGHTGLEEPPPGRGDHVEAEGGCSSMALSSSCPFERARPEEPPPVPQRSHKRLAAKVPDQSDVSPVVSEVPSAEPTPEPQSDFATPFFDEIKPLNVAAATKAIEFVDEQKALLSEMSAACMKSQAPGPSTSTSRPIDGVLLRRSIYAEMTRQLPPSPIDVAHRLSQRASVAGGSLEAITSLLSALQGAKTEAESPVGIAAAAEPNAEPDSDLTVQLASIATTLDQIRASLVRQKLPTASISIDHSAGGGDSAVACASFERMREVDAFV